MSFVWILLVLIRAGDLKQDDKTDVKKIWTVVIRRLRFATSQMETLVAPEYTFADEARNAWSRGHKDVAIVLLAVAFEQCLNGTLRLIVEANGVGREHATTILRSQNVDQKLSWFVGRRGANHIPKPLLKRVKTIFSIRNMIVHFKAVPSHPDKHEDSFSKIKREISTLGRLQIDSVFANFHNACWEAVAKKDPTIGLALELRDKLMPYESIFGAKK